MTEKVNEEKMNAVLGEINLALNNFLANNYGENAPLFAMTAEELPSEVLKIFTLVREQIENSDLTEIEKTTAWAIAARDIIIKSISPIGTMIFLREIIGMR